MGRSVLGLPGAWFSAGDGGGVSALFIQQTNCIALTVQ